jgi:exodeoxyribonuclease VII large subunit
MDHISLSDLSTLIKAALEPLSREHWVVAEVAQVNLNRRSGHCYLELVQKDGERTVAQMRAMLWKWVFKRVEADFRLQTGSELKAGMQVMFRAGVSYHEVFGLSLNITDIDPSYTLGEMARKRRETIARLEKEGLLERNRAIPMPSLPLNVAVVSSETAAGFGDFMERLRSCGYGFKVTLYPAFMQGANAEPSIIAALGAASTNAHDVVVLIRGGGSQVDLSCFDSYALAREIALFPHPVLLGIGHERDETVADLVAHKRLITPTAVADHLIGILRLAEDTVEDMARELSMLVSEILSQGMQRLTLNTNTLGAASMRLLREVDHGLSAMAGRFRFITAQSIEGARGALETLFRDLQRAPARVLISHSNQLESMRIKVKLLDPANVLTRGYSITMLDGKAVHDASTLKAGDTISTTLASGTVKSTVNETKESG